MSSRVPLAERALSQRVRAVPPSGIRRFFDIAATMDNVISLGVGEPDFDTPREIVEAGVESLREGRTDYTSNYGTLELRRALAGATWNGGTGSPTARRPRSWSRSGHRRRWISPCGRPVTRATRRSFTSPPTWRTCPPSCSRVAPSCSVATRFEDDFALDPAAVRAAVTPRTKALFLGYPCNPTGAVLDDAIQDELAEIAAETICSSTATRSTIVSPTGRIAIDRSARCRGRGSGPSLDGGVPEGLRDDRLARGLDVRAASILDGIVKAHQYGIMSAPTIAQDAALVALEDGEPAVEAMVAEYDARRRLLVDGLNRIGLLTFEPRGAFYAFPGSPRRGRPRTSSPSGCCTRSRWPWCRAARSARRGGARADVLCDGVRPARGGYRPDRSLRGPRAHRLRRLIPSALSSD